MGIIESGSSAEPTLLYIAVADEAAGEIDCKRVELDGTPVGDVVTFKTLP